MNIVQNESETEFHRVYKVSPTQQVTKLTHLLRESGAAVVGSVESDSLRFPPPAHLLHGGFSSRAADQTCEFPSAAGWFPLPGAG